MHVDHQHHPSLATGHLLPETLKRRNFGILWHGRRANQACKGKHGKQRILLNVGDKVVNGHGATNGLQFINDSIQTNFENNVTIMQNGGFKTRKNIRAGEELLVSYGKGYWSTRKEALKREVGLLAAPKQQQQNHCGAWTMVYMLQELYPDLFVPKRREQDYERVVGQISCARHSQFEGKPSFAGGDNSCFIDYIYVGSVWFLIPTMSRLIRCTRKSTNLRQYTTSMRTAGPFMENLDLCSRPTILVTMPFQRTSGCANVSTSPFVIFLLSTRRSKW